MNTRTSYRRKPARNEYWQKVQDERNAQDKAKGDAMKAYNAARMEWEQGGKVGRQPSLVDFSSVNWTAA